MIDAVAIAGICLGGLALLISVFGYRRESNRRAAAEAKASRLEREPRYTAAQWQAVRAGYDRSGFERLLVAHPYAEVAWVENQREDVVGARREQSAPFERVNTEPGPWTCVDLYENGKILRFAIWNRTDTVYALDEGGAVGEEPYL